MSFICRIIYWPYFRLSEQLNRMEQRIMSAISVFKEKVDIEFGKIGASVDGLVTDLDTLNKKIEDLQNSNGAITPEDQAILDDIQARAVDLSDRLAGLDAATEAPPEPPTA